MYSSNKGDVVSYFKRVTEFTEAAAQYASRQSEAAIYCPCKDCKNEAMYPCSDRGTICFHLLKNGFMKNYYIWTKHGEIGENPSGDSDVPQDAHQHRRGCDHTSDITHDVDQHDDDDAFDVEELMRNVAPEVLLQRTTAKGYDNFEALDKASKNLLYEERQGCDKQYTVLYTTLELMKLKASNGWSDTSFSDLMQLLKKVLPKPNDLPSDTYQAKKMICPLTLSVQKIHACPNHYILYQKMYELLERCPQCNTSRYKRANDCVEDYNDHQKKNKRLQKWKRNVIADQ